MTSPAPKPFSLEGYLSSRPLTDEQRRKAFNVYKNATDRDGFVSAFQDLDLPSDVKKDLYNAKYAEAGWKEGSQKGPSPSAPSSSSPSSAEGFGSKLAHGAWEFGKDLVIGGPKRFIEGFQEANSAWKDAPIDILEPGHEEELEQRRQATLKGTAKMVGGAGQTAGTVMAPLLFKAFPAGQALAKLGLGLVEGTAGYLAGKHGSRALGAGEGTSELVGEVGSLLPFAHLGPKLVRGLKERFRSEAPPAEAPTPAPPPAEPVTVTAPSTATPAAPTGRPVPAAPRGPEELYWNNKEKAARVAEAARLKKLPKAMREIEFLERQLEEVEKVKEEGELSPGLEGSPVSRSQSRFLKDNPDLGPDEAIVVLRDKIRERRELALDKLKLGKRSSNPDLDQQMSFFIPEEVQPRITAPKPVRSPESPQFAGMTKEQYRQKAEEVLQRATEETVPEEQERLLAEAQRLAQLGADAPSKPTREVVVPGNLPRSRFSRLSTFERERLTRQVQEGRERSRLLGEEIEAAKTAEMEDGARKDLLRSLRQQLKENRLATRELLKSSRPGPPQQAEQVPMFMEGGPRGIEMGTHLGEVPPASPVRPVPALRDSPPPSAIERIDPAQRTGERAPDLPGTKWDQIKQRFVRNFSSIEKMGEEAAKLANKAASSLFVHASVAKLGKEVVPRLESFGKSWKDFANTVISSRLMGQSEWAGKKQEWLMGLDPTTTEGRAALMKELSSSNDRPGLSEFIDGWFQRNTDAEGSLTHLLKSAAMETDPQRSGELWNGVWESFSKALRFYQAKNLEHMPLPAEQVHANIQEPWFQEAREGWRGLEKELALAHEGAGGEISTERLGPAQTYYPLLDEAYMARVKEGRNNLAQRMAGFVEEDPNWWEGDADSKLFSSGLADSYDASLDGLRINLSRRYLADQKAALAHGLVELGLALRTPQGKVLRFSSPQEATRFKEELDTQLPWVNLGGFGFSPKNLEVVPVGKREYLIMPKRIASELSSIFSPRKRPPTTEEGLFHTADLTTQSMLQFMLSGFTDNVFNIQNMIGSVAPFMWNLRLRTGGAGAADKFRTGLANLLGNFYYTYRGLNPKEPGLKFSQPIEGVHLETLQEMAKLGILDPRSMRATNNPTLARQMDIPEGFFLPTLSSTKTGRAVRKALGLRAPETELTLGQVARKEAEPPPQWGDALLYGLGPYEGIKLRNYIYVWNLAKQMNPLVKDVPLANFCRRLIDYSPVTGASVDKAVKGNVFGRVIAPFLTPKRTKIVQGLEKVFEPLTLLLDMSMDAKDFSTGKSREWKRLTKGIYEGMDPAKVAQIRLSLALYRGILTITAFGIVMNKFGPSLGLGIGSGKYPWEDPDWEWDFIPFSDEVQQHPVVRKMVGGNRRLGIRLSTLFSRIGTGMSVLGARAAWEKAHDLDYSGDPASLSQYAKAAGRESVNNFLGFASGPLPAIGESLLGNDLYLTSNFQDLTGRPALQFREKWGQTANPLQRAGLSAKSLVLDSNPIWNTVATGVSPVLDPLQVRLQNYLLRGMGKDPSPYPFLPLKPYDPRPAHAEPEPFYSGAMQGFNYIPGVISLLTSRPPTGKRRLQSQRDLLLSRKAAQRSLLGQPSYPLE